MGRFGKTARSMKNRRCFSGCGWFPEKKRFFIPEIACYFQI